MTVTIENVAMPNETFLPTGVTDVPRELLKGFPHSKKVGNYLLGKTLGEGSFAKVKEGLHVLTGEKVAVKVMDKKKAREDAYVRKNLRREGKLLSAVRHPNVVQLLEVMETENSYYLVTELCRGGDLMELICTKKRLDEKTVKKFIKQILLAVQHLHTLGILHRDLKVENLLLDENKNIKIIDFGLSNSVRVSQSPDGSNSMQEFCVTQCGSPAYAAPELLGNAKYGPKVDVWSIGVNMYAMLVGSLPFTVEPFNIKALHKKMLNGEINTIPAHLSTHCKDFLKKLLVPDPNKRINISDALRHSWISEGRSVNIETQSLNLTEVDLDSSILKHMSHSMGFRLSEIIRLVTCNIPHGATAIYYLLRARLDAFLTSNKVQGKITQSRVSKATLEKRKSGGLPVVGKDLIDLLPIEENISDNGTKDQGANGRILPNTISPRKIPASRGERRVVSKPVRNRYVRRPKPDLTSGDTTDDDRGGVTSRDTSRTDPGSGEVTFRPQLTTLRAADKKSNDTPANRGMGNTVHLQTLDVPTDSSQQTGISSSEETRDNTPEPGEARTTGAPLSQRQNRTGRTGTISDQTNGQRWKSGMPGGSRAVRQSSNQAVIDTAQYDRFARKSSFNSTSNSLNSSIGSGGRPARQLISLNYSANHSTGQSSPLSRLNTHDELPTDGLTPLPGSPRRVRLSSVHHDSSKVSRSPSTLPKTARSSSFKDSGFDEETLFTTLPQINRGKPDSINAPFISPPPTIK